MNKKATGQTIVLEGNGQRPSHHGDGYKESDVMYTLNTTEVHAVAYGFDRATYKQGTNALYDFTIEAELAAPIVARGPGGVFQPTKRNVKQDEKQTTNRPKMISMRPGTHVETGENIAPPLAARDYKDPIFFACEKKEAWCMTTRYYIGFGCNQTPTLLARDYKDPTVVACEKEEEQMSENEMKYIVRRLTPTECARLQGFPDWWAQIDECETLNDEQYQFWSDVRKTFDEINGRTPKEYTREQIRKWHNGLHTDSSEYKMWGNGIALPCFEFIMQGIQETREDGD